MLALPFAAACTVAVDESAVLQPRRDPGPGLGALSAWTPGYVLSEQAIASADGTRLHGLLLKKEGASRTILYFGGNMFQVGRHAPYAAGLLGGFDANIFLVDYRGSGRSEGAPTIDTMKADALAVYDHVASLGAKTIIVHGQSLGSFMAGYVAANRETAGVVLESSATTTEAWVEAGVPRIAKGIARIRISEALRGEGNLQHMAALEEPLLIIVGEKDGTTPPSMSRALYAASTLATDRKSLLVVEGAGHNDALAQPTAVAAYRAFLQRTAIKE